MEASTMGALMRLIDDDVTGGLSDRAFRLLVFILASGEGDRKGGGNYGEAALSRMRGRVFWAADEVKASDVKDALDELAGAGLISEWEDSEGNGRWSVTLKARGQ